jgi:hypothetical protein
MQVRATVGLRIDGKMPKQRVRHASDSPVMRLLSAVTAPMHELVRRSIGAASNDLGEPEASNGSV